MGQVRAGMWDDSVLVVENIDRFSRQNPFTVVGYINDLVQHGVSIHDVNALMVISRQNSMMLPIVIMNAQRMEWHTDTGHLIRGDIITSAHQR